MSNPPLAQVLAIARQICAALEHAHARGIIHRDLKPENVVITQSQTAKLMDFGLARAADAPHLTEEGSLVGTFSYLAPELLLGQPASVQSDLYALGVMLYELATGQPPFTGDDVVAVISQHLHATVIPPSTHNPTLPPALESLILRLLSKQPADRPVSAAEVRQMLERLDAVGALTAPVEAASLLDRIVRGRLVARERELADATALWRRTVAGEGGVLLISGEPGIGKTRLVRELMAQSELARATALVGECYAEGAAPYAPLAQIIQAAFNLPSPREAFNLPPLVLAGLLTLAPALSAHFPDVPPNPPLDPQTEQQRLIESLAEFCAALTAPAPVLLAVEDIHWADSGTLMLLRHLARRAAGARHATPLRLLLVLTYREVELDEARALNEMLLDLNRERLGTRLKLMRLSRDQTRDLLAAMFAEDITPELLDGIYRETEGNPFFVEEVCKTLIEAGNIYRENGHWARLSMDQVQVPQSVRVAIQMRVNRLPAPAQEALRLAAVLGREFDFETLQKAGDQDEDALIEALESAERAQLIGETHRAGRMTFVFAHALIPAALRDSVSGLRLQRLHRRAAVAIMALRPDDFETLAHHYAAAGERSKALECSRQAAQRAKSVYAYDAALQHLHNALDLLDLIESGEPTEQHLVLLEQLGDVQRQLGEFAKAVPTYQQALDVWRSLPGAAKWTAVRLHHKLITMLVLAPFPIFIGFEAAHRASLHAGLKLIEGEPPHPETVRLLAALGLDAWVRRAPSDWEAAEGYARAAVTMA
jgi:tetratricopeptide (TPR) repeat protein